MKYLSKTNTFCCEEAVKANRLVFFHAIYNGSCNLGETYSCVNNSCGYNNCGFKSVSHNMSARGMASLCHVD